MAMWGHERGRPRCGTGLLGACTGNEGDGDDEAGANDGQHVVIVGGGVAGIHCAYRLEQLQRTGLARGPLGEWDGDDGSVLLLLCSGRDLQLAARRRSEVWARVPALSKGWSWRELKLNFCRTPRTGNLR